MKLGARRILYAMYRPPSTTVFETDVIGRVPVTRGKDRYAVLLSGRDVLVQNRDDTVAFVYPQRAARTKVVLQIDDEQSVARVEFWKLHTLIISRGVRCS